MINIKPKDLAQRDAYTTATIPFMGTFRCMNALNDTRGGRPLFVPYTRHLNTTAT